MQTKTLWKASLSDIRIKEPRKFHSVPDVPAFLYIGKDRNLELQLIQIFKEGIFVADFNQAVEVLNQCNKLKSISFILIDVAFEKERVVKFVNYLKYINIPYAIPVVYNDAKISISNQNLKEFSFLDDVIELDHSCSFLFDRIEFLRLAKNNYQEINKKKQPNKSLNRTPDTMRYISKRIIDLVIASFALILLMPILVVIALLVKLDSKGPIIYTSKRAGKGYKVFEFYKFRTMEVNADKKIDALAHLNQYDISKSGPTFFKLNNDPRITKIGKFLRNSSLDELPQLINVIKGDMSLVGNRPLPLYEAATLTTNDYCERFMAPSGITGLWQIMKRGKPLMSVQERVELDIKYAKKFNVIYDIRIMLKTPAALFQKTSV